jgi:hypothetical protein
MQQGLQRLREGRSELCRSDLCGRSKLRSQGGLRQGLLP